MASCPITAEEAAHMKMRQRDLRARGLTKAETWAKIILKEKTKLKWTSEAIWRWRLYDFWNSHKGIAVEIDGPEHNRIKDKIRDASDYERSGIVVLRVRNFNETDMAAALKVIEEEELWLMRRARMGLLTKKQIQGLIQWSRLEIQTST